MGEKGGKPVNQSMLKPPSPVGKLREKVERLFEKIVDTKNLLTQWELRRENRKMRMIVLIDNH